MDSGWDPDQYLSDDGQHIECPAEHLGELSVAVLFADRDSTNADDRKLASRVLSRFVDTLVDHITGDDRLQDAIERERAVLPSSEEELDEMISELGNPYELPGPEVLAYLRERATEDKDL